MYLIVNKSFKVQWKHHNNFTEKHDRAVTNLLLLLHLFQTTEKQGDCAIFFRIDPIFDKQWSWLKSSCLMGGEKCFTNTCWMDGWMAREIRHDTNMLLAIFPPLLLVNYLIWIVPFLSTDKPSKSA